MESAQRVIFHSPEVRVVEASAGSGKTYALAKRYIQLLLNPSLKFEQIPIRNILAITFTNKAAFEMKARILEFLKKIALGRLSSSEEKEILEPLGITSKAAASKAFSIMEDLIRHYNFFQVQTIDKFINGLLSGCAFRIGLTANFRIKTNSQEYLACSLDQLIDQAFQDRKLFKIFQEFLHHYLYLENRSGWFPKEDMLSIICDLFRQYNYYDCLFKASPFDAEDIIKKKKDVLEDLRKLEENLPLATDKRFAGSLEGFLKKHTRSFDVDSLSEYFNREEFPLRKNGELPKSVEKQWQKIHRDLKDLVCKESYSLFNPYISIFHLVRQEFLKLSAKDDCLFLEELNKKAGLLFDEDYITVEELYYRLAARFRHYLADEFQDTSRLQWHNLEKMVEEALSTGGSFFYVGDRKQAIYSFRGGDVQLFDDIKERFGPFNVQEDFLTKNWRSHKAIVEFNNALFSWDNLKGFIERKEAYEQQKNKHKAVGFTAADREEIKEAFQTAQQSYRPEKTKGFVRIEYLEADKKEESHSILREKIIALIQDLKSRFAPQDITLLARSNSEVEQLTSWLLEEGILVESERTSNVKENFFIEELILFLKFLNSPIDNFSFSRFILGEIFGKVSGINKEGLHAFLFSQRERLPKEKDFYIYTEFRRIYPDVWDQLIDEFFRNVGLYPLYELLISIYHRFKVLENFSEYQGFWMHFLEIIKGSEEEHADLSSFLGYFDNLKGEELYVPVMDSGAIKILTIHKSKGLEFPVVILPFLGMEIQVGSQGPDQSQSYILKREDDTMNLLRLKTKYLQFSEELYQIYVKEYKKTFLAELNNIYVALTRPQCELYAFVPKKIRGSFNLTKFLIPEGQVEWGEKGNYESKMVSAQEKNIMAIPPADYHNWIEYLREEFLDLDALKNREKKQQGELTHFILSFVKNLKENNLEDYLQQAQNEMRLYFPHIPPEGHYFSQVQPLVEAKALRPFFYIEEGKVLTEAEIVSKKGHIKRIDRLIVKAGEVWVVDYKQSRDFKDHQAQIREYMELISELYPNHKIRGFLVYLETRSVEAVDIEAGLRV